jgi:hypothetical protein
MLVKNNDDLVYKMDIPWWFYPRVLIPFAVAIALYIVKAEYEIIVLFSVLGFFFTLNGAFFVIEVYEGYFKIILPSAWFDRLLRIERTFYYGQITEYECEFGSNPELTTKTEWLFVIMLAMMLGRGRLHTTAGSRNKFSQLSFLYIQEGVSKTISRWFDASQTKELAEANKHIQERLKKAA